MPAINFPRYFGCIYVAVMATVGALLVTMAATLDLLALHCHVPITKMSLVFFCQSMGALIGAYLSHMLFRSYSGNLLIGFALIASSVLAACTPFSTDLLLLHGIYIFLGIFTAIADTGCQIMTRKVFHHSAAAPWLGSNALALSLGGAVVVMVNESIYLDAFLDFLTLAISLILLAMLLIFSPDPMQLMAQSIRHRGVKEGDSEVAQVELAMAREELQREHYYIEYTVFAMLMLVIGGLTSMTAFLKAYAAESGLLNYQQARWLLISLWLSSAAGRLLAVVDQARGVNVQSLPQHFTAVLLVGAVAMLLVLLNPSNSSVLWLGVCLYGLCNGPTVAFCFQWVVQAAHADETSMAIAIFGLNLGTGILPYVVTTLWRHGIGRIALIWITMLTMLLPIPLLHWSRGCSYIDNVNPNTRFDYVPIA